MMKIWLCNLGKYNEGNLVGQWVDLPVDSFKPIFDEIGINEEYEEYFIADWESDCYEIGEYDNICLLNYAAKLVEDYCMGNGPYITYDYKIAEINVALLHTPVSNVVEFINLLLQLDNLEFMHFSNKGDANTRIGELFAEIEGVDSYLAERNLEGFFDYEAYGSEIAMDYTVDDGVMLSDQENIYLDRYSYDEIKEMMSN